MIVITQSRETTDKQVVYWLEQTVIKTLAK